MQRAAKRSGASLIRDLSRLRIRKGPGSAAHRCALRCAREKSAVYRVGTGDEILGSFGKEWNGVVLTLKIDFNIERHRINGYVAFLLDLTALKDLRHYIDQYIARLTP